MQIDEALVDSQAANAAAIKNARLVVIKKKLVGLFKSSDGSLLFGDCNGRAALPRRLFGITNDLSHAN